MKILSSTSDLAPGGALFDRVKTLSRGELEAEVEMIFCSVDGGYPPWENNKKYTHTPYTTIRTSKMDKGYEPQYKGSRGRRRSRRRGNGS